MTWLAFFASVIGSLAWPTAFVVLAFGFRKQLTTILGRLIRAKGFGGEVEFSQQLDKAADLAPPVVAKQDAVLSAPSQTATGTSGPDKSEEKPKPPAISSHDYDPPEYRVISAWNLLFSELSQLAARKGFHVSKRSDFREINQIGPTLGLTQDEIAQINALRKLRNQAARGTVAVTVTDAVRYEDLVITLLSRIPSL